MITTVSSPQLGQRSNLIMYNRILSYCSEQGIEIDSFICTCKFFDISNSQEFIFHENDFSPISTHTHTALSYKNREYFSLSLSLSFNHICCKFYSNKFVQLFEQFVLSADTFPSFLTFFVSLSSWTTVQFEVASDEIYY